MRAATRSRDGVGSVSRVVSKNVDRSESGGPGGGLANSVIADVAANSPAPISLLAIYGPGHLQRYGQVARIMRRYFRPNRPSWLCRLSGLVTRLRPPPDARAGRAYLMEALRAA